MRLPDASGATPLARMTVARGTLKLDPGTLTAFEENDEAVARIATAQTAGIQAAKFATHLIPPHHGAHPTDAFLEMLPGDNDIACTATIQAVSRTGLESPATLAVTTALTTLWEILRVAGYVGDGDGPAMEIGVVQSVTHT